MKPSNTSRSQGISGRPEMQTVGLWVNSTGSRTVQTTGEQKVNKSRVLSSLTENILNEVTTKKLSNRSVIVKSRSVWDGIGLKLEHWLSSKFDVFYSEEEASSRKLSRSREQFSNGIVDALKSIPNKDSEGIKKALFEINEALDITQFDKETRNSIVKEAIKYSLENVSSEVLQTLYNVSDKDLLGYPSAMVAIILEGVTGEMKNREIDFDSLKANFRISCYTSSFQDEALKGDMKVLGSGAVNTVFLATYEIDGIETTQVFKGEETKITGCVAPIYSGIDKTIPMLSERSIASSKLDELLGFGVIVKTQPALHNGVRGIVMEKAEGKAPTEVEILSDINESTRKIYQNAIDEYGIQFDAKGDPIGSRNKEMFESLTKAKGIRMIEGELKIVNAAFIKIDYNHPEYRRSMMMLQLEDIIAGQVDRHQGNYLINVGKDGTIYGIKGIDNDFAFGYRINDFNELDGLTTSMYGLNIVRLPHVVDREMYRKIMGLNDLDIESILGESFTKKEIEAAKSRLSILQKHLENLEKKGNIIDPDEWGSEKARELLAIKEPFKDGRGEIETSYVQRSIETLDYYQSTEGKFVVNIEGTVLNEEGAL